MNELFQRWAVGACLALLPSLAPSLAYGQATPMFQSGTAVPYDVTRFNSNGLAGTGSQRGVLGDTPSGRGLNPFAVTDFGHPGICTNSDKTSLAYTALCLGHDAAGNGIISLTSGNGHPNETIELSINGVNVPFPGTISGLPVVLSNTELQLLASSYAALVVRQDFAAGNGSPPIFYASSGSACSLNSGAGDGGAQIPTSDGGCWNMRPPAGGVFDVRIWGAKVDGVTDDSAVEIKANTAITTLYGGGTILVPATGNCMLGQNFTAGSGPLGAAVTLKGAGIGACLKLKASATGPLFQTPNAYLYMQRRVTGAITEASFTIPVSDTANVTAGQTFFVMDNTGIARLAVIANPAVSGSNILISSWVSGAFSAASGSWWGNLNDVGPANTGIEDLVLDGNISNQTPVNNNIAAAQTLGGAGNLTLVNSGQIPTPYSNLFLEFYTPGNISGVTFTITCNYFRSDLTTASQSFTITGLNAGWAQARQAGCNKVTQIAADGAVASPVTVGVPDGAGSQDCIVHYGPGPRYRNVVAQNCRGWPYRFAFVPGTGFTSVAPAGRVYGQEAYLENLQCFISNAGGMWFNGPNDSRTKSFACNFMSGVGLFIDRFAGGAKFNTVHISGGNTGLPVIGLKEPQIGILSLSDSVHCESCTSEEAAENIVILANNNVFTDFEVFHADDGTDRTGIKIGAAGGFSLAPILGTVMSGKCKNLGLGCFNFSTEGGWGDFSATGYVQGVFVGKPAYQGTPSLCGASGSGSKFNINIVAASATTPINPLVKPGPCTPWTPQVRFGGANYAGGAAPSQTSTGELTGNIAEFRVAFTANPATGAIRMNSPFPANQTCIVHAAFLSGANSLTGSLNGILQGGTVSFQQWSASGTDILNETGAPAPFVSGTNFFGTIGPCIRP